jgi:hypothetical protein
MNVAVSVMSLVTAGGCYHAARYDGDGQLTDAGWLVFMGNRYRLDLGPVDLATPGRHTFRLSDLPRTEFTAGVEITVAEPRELDDAQVAHTSYVRLELKTSAGEIAVLEEGPLNSWVWSHALQGSIAFVYRRGERKDVPLRNGNTRVERVGIKEASGWGTYFTAERSETYFLTLEVVDPSSTATKPAHLILYGDH